MTGEEIRNILRERIEHHTQRAERWRVDAGRPSAERTDAAAWMPGEWCESEADAEDWRAQRLAFLRDNKSFMPELCGMVWACRGSP